jgi:hypothetical protein
MVLESIRRMEWWEGLRCSKLPAPGDIQQDHYCAGGKPKLRHEANSS